MRNTHHNSLRELLRCVTEMYLGVLHLQLLWCISRQSSLMLMEPTTYFLSQYFCRLVKACLAFLCTNHIQIFVHKMYPPEN